MEIKAPDLGVDSAEVSEIMVQVGDVIEKDDNIILIESDKASVEVPSSAAGKVTNINVEVGDQVSEGTVLIELDSDSSADEEQAPAAEEQSAAPQDESQEAKSADDKDKQTESESQQSKPAAAEAGQATTHALPDLGVDEAQVAEIMVSVGDTISADQSILLIESDKASVEVLLQKQVKSRKSW